MKYNFTLLLFAFSLTLMGQAPGTLDETFGDYDGAAYFGLAGGDNSADDHVVQEDDKVIVVGRANEFLMVGRTHPDGTYDTSFGTDGEVLLDFNGNTLRANVVSLQSDGKIILAGYMIDGDGSNMMVARLLPSGVIDTTFGEDGWAFYEVLAWSNSLSELVVLPDDSIIVGGSSREEPSSADVLVLVKYTPNGTLDSNFGDNGLVVTEAIGNYFPEAITPQPDGKILVLTRNSVIRYHANGTLDDTFGTNGEALLDFWDDADFDETYDAFLLRPDGKIVVGGDIDFLDNPSQSRQVSVGQLDEFGNIDADFGDGGATHANFDLTTDFTDDMLLQPDGKILVYGASRPSSYWQFALVRFNEEGSMDTTYGANGISLIDMYIAYPESISYQSDGKLIISGTTLFPDDSTSLSLLRVFSGFNLGLLDFENGNANFAIVPNPVASTTKLNYTLQKSEILQLRLYDLSGKLVKRFRGDLEREAGTNSEELDFSNIAAGMYTLKISNKESSSVSLKILKQ